MNRESIAQGTGSTFLNQFGENITVKLNIFGYFKNKYPDFDEESIKGPHSVRYSRVDSNPNHSTHDQIS